MPDDFGDLHGKLFQHFLDSAAYRERFPTSPVICISVSTSKTYRRTANHHPVLGVEYQQDDYSLTDEYFGKMGLQVRYFMPPGSVAPLAFYFRGDLLGDYTNLQLIGTISTMETFQKIYRPEIYNANSAAASIYRPSLEQQDFSRTQIAYDRDERSQLAVTAGEVHGGALREAAQRSAGAVGRRLPRSRRMTRGESSIMNTLLPTSIVGSLPKPSWLAEPETLWSPWKLEGDALVEGKQDALRIAVQEQRRRGIDIVSDGEQTRQHFVTTFIEHLSGVDFEQRETVRIRDRYDASVPTVVGAVSREKPVFVDDAKFLRQQTDQPIKWALPGPMTMIDTLYDRHYKSREKLAWEFATILNQEAKELEAAGVDIIQFDEPAFNVFLDEVQDWGVATLERAAEGLRARDRRAHLLRLRHQGEHRLEGDPRAGVAAVREVVPAAAAVHHRHRLAGMPALPCADGPHRAHPRQEGHARGDRRGERDDRDPGGGRRHPPEGARSSSTRTSSSRARTAAWRRCLGTSRSGS